MIASIAVGACLGRRTQRGLPLSPREKLGIGLGAFCGAMIGAKLPFVLSDWSGLLSGAAWFTDGKTILFGLVGGYLGVEAAKWALGVRVKTGDSFAVPVAAAIGVGRLACFVGGCCYGTPTDLPWGVVFGGVDSLPRHPTQLYESAFHLAMACVLWELQQRGRDRRQSPPRDPGGYRLRGQLIKLYIIAYLAYRFATEFIRPEARLWGGLTGYQWSCVLLAGVFAVLWRRDAAACATSPVGGRS
ncbi:MAG: diacylglyceryl transferase [Planctomycetota bacterium]|nr:MAG: diacylglyceryl transferase [Planctomycetota bacterium]